MNEPPPPMDAGAAAALLDERAYRDVPKPLAESLDQCAERLRPFLEVELTAAMRKAVDECGFVAEQDGLPVEVPTFVISASENVLRALVRELEGLSDDETPLIDVPHATPLVYRLDSALRPLPSTLAKSPLRKGWYMADPERIAATQKSIREEVDCRLNDVPCKVDEEDEDYTNECINISLGLRASGSIYKALPIDKVLSYIDAKKDCYEVLNNDVNRVYGDVDFSDVDKAFETAGQPYTIDAFNQQDNIYKNSLVSSIEHFLECYELPTSAYCLYTASKYDCKKISWRFVLNKVITTKKGNLHLVKQLDEVFRANQERYNTINNTILTFDKSIYSAPSEKGMGQKMRMLGTSKPGENRPLVMVKGQPIDTIISYITEDSLFMKPPPAEPVPTYTSNSSTNNATLSELSDLLEILPKKYLETLKGNPPTVKYGAFQVINAILNSYKISPELRDVILKYIPRPNNRGDIKWVNDVIRRYTPPPANVKPLTIATLYYLVEDKDKLQALRDKYKKVYYKEIVGYTLPNDWNLMDDYQNENGYLRDIPTDLPSALIDSHLGTGKTTQIKRLIKAQSAKRSEPLKLVKSKLKARVEPVNQSSILISFKQLIK